MREGSPGCRVLVAEDNRFIADELARLLETAGVIVLGPLATVDEALEFVEARAGIELVVLAIDLNGRGAFPVADTLAERRIPFVFVTGYADASVPARYANIARYEKPVDGEVVNQVLRQKAPAQPRA